MSQIWDELTIGKSCCDSFKILRICCTEDGDDGFYELAIDGQMAKEGGDYGENDSYTFGNCNCAELTIELNLPDASQSEMWQSLMIDDGISGLEIWSRSTFSADWSEETTLNCLDPNLCYVYFLEDYGDDGSSGSLRIEFDGEELYNGGWDADGGFIDIGAC